MAVDTQASDVQRYVGTELVIAILPQLVQDAYRAHMIFASPRTLEALKQAIAATKAG